MRFKRWMPSWRPVSPFPAFRLGEKVDDPLAMYLSDIYTHHRQFGGHSA